ncbi:biosynthetic peptidoglycan transglycosylase [Nonomuraea sp. NBC_00507]|uniref:biosynthetic peptidoglycan transglycosylase n=1 Tax=Nonomuraea sp. NBC_00507 TaxID=2976002 RepID=UPI002E192F73
MSGRGRKIVRLAAAGAAAGVLMAGIAVPAVGGAGFGLVAAAGEVDLEPADLVEPPQAEVTIVRDAKGNVIARFYEEYREIVGLDDIAEVMKTAIVAIEDYRFYEHGAIDIEGTLRALATNLQAGRVSQGGSSITQQYVKQVLLNSAGTERERNAALEATYARRRQGRRPDPAAGGDAGGRRTGPQRHRPQPRQEAPGTAPEPPQRRAEPDGGAGQDHPSTRSSAIPTSARRPRPAWRPSTAAD